MYTQTTMLLWGSRSVRTYAPYLRSLPDREKHKVVYVRVPAEFVLDVSWAFVICFEYRYDAALFGTIGRTDHDVRGWKCCEDAVLSRLSYRRGFLPDYNS